MFTCVTLHKYGDINIYTLNHSLVNVLDMEGDLAELKVESTLII